MKYEKFKYGRPNLEDLEKTLADYLIQFDKAETSKHQELLVRKIYKLFSDFESMASLAYLKKALDIKNDYYLNESRFFDNNFPKYNNLISDFYYRLVNSKYKEELQEELGNQLFRIAEDSLKTFNIDIEKDLKTETRLINKYESILANAMISINGRKKNIYEMQPFMESDDRCLRKESYHSFYNYFSDFEKEIDLIYDKLVKVRDKISRKLGFKNYVELSNARLHRFYYSTEKINKFREQVVKHIVPISKTIKDKQMENLGLNELKIYDSLIKYKTGNPKPVGDAKNTISNFKIMFEEFSPETGKFFDYLLDNNLIDFDSRKNKDVSLYCTYIYKYKSPFIFVNFNGTQYDITSFIHEFGHAYQFYCCHDFYIKDYIIPTVESVEIPSISLEFLTLPWMNLFFQKDTMKYIYDFISTSLKSIVTHVCGDEFQNYIYENPDISINERKIKWKELDSLYYNKTDYDGIQNLENGCGWHLNRHFFSSPLFFIDYAIADICGFQFWRNSQLNNKKTIKNYLKICEAGGSISFEELIKLANLNSPFEEGSIKSLVEYIKKLLSKIE